jgi:hypothetical protein
MDLHRFWDGVITSSSNLTRLRNEASALRNRQAFQRGQLTELASTEFELWAKESFEIAMCSPHQTAKYGLWQAFKLILHCHVVCFVELARQCIHPLPDQFSN